MFASLWNDKNVFKNYKNQGCNLTEFMLLIIANFKKKWIVKIETSEVFKTLQTFTGPLIWKGFCISSPADKIEPEILSFER